MNIKFFNLVGQPYQVSPGPRLPPHLGHLPEKERMEWCGGDPGAHPFLQRGAPSALDFARAASPLRNATLAEFRYAAEKTKNKDYNYKN